MGMDTTIRVNGETAHEVLAQLVDIEKSEILLTAGRLNRAAEAQESLGKHLGAELVGEESKRGTPEPEPTVAQEKNAGTFGTTATLPPWAKIVPNAPLVNGQPAWLVNGKSSDGRPWVAFVHPSADIDPKLPETDDPNDPRLAAGQAKFRKFIR